MLVVPFVVQLVSAVGVIGYLAFRNERNTVENLAHQLMDKANGSVRLQLDSYLTTPHLLNQASKNLIGPGILRSPNEIQQFFIRQILSTDSIHYMAWGDRQGNYIDAAQLPDGTLTSSLADASTRHQFYTYRVNAEGKRERLVQTSGPYDPRTRPWYQAALKSKQATWSPIYVWFDRSKIAFDAVLPVYDAAGRELGVLDIPVTLSTLSDFLRQLSHQQVGQYFIVEPSGALVATSTEEKLWVSGRDGQVRRQFAADSETPLIRASWQQLSSLPESHRQSNQPVQLNFKWQGQRQYLQVSPIREQGLDWMMVAVIPESSFMAQADTSTHTTILLALLAFAIATGAVILTAQWVARPILQLNATVKRFVTRFGGDRLSQQSNEVEELAHSFQTLSEELQTSLLKLQGWNAELEQRVAERTQELAQANDRFEAFMNHNPVCAWITDVNGKILYVNQTYLQTFQAASSNVIGKGVFELYDPEIAEHALISTQTVVETRQRLELITRVPRTDDTFGEFLIYKFPIINQSDQSWVGGIALDITERRHMEEALRASEAYSSRLAAIVESSSDAILSKSLDGIILSWNAGAERLFGYTADEAIGRHLAFLTPPERADDMDYDLQKIQQGDTEHFETERLRKDGQRIDVSVTISPINDKAGQITALSAIYRDITAHKRAQAEAQEGKRILDALMDYIPEGITIADAPDVTIRRVSKYGEHLTGRSRDILEDIAVDQHVQAWGIFQADGITPATNEELPLTRAVQHGEVVQNEEWVLQRPNGTQVNILCNAGPVRDQDGKVTGGVIAWHDISDRKQAERTLQENEQFLRSIYNGVEQAIFVIDVSDDGEFYFVGLNTAHERLSGLRSADLQGKTPEQFFPAEIAIALRQRYQTCVEAGETITYEECLPFQGKLTWWITSLTPLRDPASRIYRIVGTSININDRKQAEKQLELQDQIVRTMAEGVCLVREADGVIVYTNPKFEQMFGYDVGELVNQSVNILNYWDDTVDAEAVTREILSSIDANSEYSYEVHNRKKDGTPFWCQATTSKFEHPDHGVTYVAVQADITDRKALEQEIAHQRYLLEQELAHNRQLLDAFITSAPVGMAVLDRQLRYTLVNQALADNNRLEIIDHLGKTIWDIVPDFARSQSDLFQHALRTGETILGTEIVGEMPSQPGVKRTWLVSLFPIKTQSSVAGLADSHSEMAADSLGMIITEITDRKQAEEQIKVSLKEKEVLLQEVHHRVKNNLQIVDSLLQMQQRRTQDQQAANILLESQNRIKSIALVHEKLYRSDDLAKIDFADYVHSLTSNLIDSYQTNSHRITLRTDVEAIELDIDTAIPCGLIINELFTNALKYAFPGDRPGNIQITFGSPEPGWLVLVVQDNGIGIADTVDLKKLRSLGLKMVRTLVTQLEGSVDIERQGGTLITVKFPHNPFTVTCS
jgi:PAS domain S-box-containing protein